MTARSSYIVVLGLQQDSEDAEHSNDNKREGLPGDGDVRPGTHRDGGARQTVYKHVDKIEVVPWNVSFHISSETNKNWNCTLHSPA